ncbi:hypothetical protein [Treponema brennaborense]|uniref:Uncharacterized protein n=1 Tax=Treponema brennaborense (strain DSM 12168 / CIP 105900 / DD5/3) TaxID=906968 RepID=F4LL28_TREBD|nr:hypothetical protein [Treponema brennaborense]AEE17602.1 hypothetical protein Trebr_2190 [Treponema brennaborense DSM 12168]
MEISENNQNNVILQFVDTDVVRAFGILSSSDKDDADKAAACTVADVFGAGLPFKAIVEASGSVHNDAEQKLIASFHSNLKLLVEKTWVEKSDEALKQQVLYRLERICGKLADGEYADCYTDFIAVLSDVVYLLFGVQAKKEDFAEYALRIDPEFGIFWWYVRSLPQTPSWPAEKCRIVMLLGMYFLANY